jgi:isochorismate hydrolase
LIRGRTRSDGTTMVKRLVPDRCFGAIIDVQEYFLSQVSNRILRSKTEANMTNFARLLGYFRIPIVATLERPVYGKGPLPAGLKKHLGARVEFFEKDFFDLTKEKKIRTHIGRLKRKQAVIAGCETDVCVLQSCLGLLDLGCEVYVVEDLLFSSARNVDSAIARMAAEGAVLLTYKTLFYELIAAVDGGQHAKTMVETFGPFPDDIPDCAAR